MREIEDANVLHKSDSDYNRNVGNAIKIAKRARNPRDYIDYLGGIKDWKAIEERAEWEFANKGNEPITKENSTNEYEKNTRIKEERVVEEEER